MPLSDIVAAALARPAGRVVEGPVRNIVNEVLQDHGYASPADVQALNDRIKALTKLVTSLEARMAAAEQAADAVHLELEARRSARVVEVQPPAAADAGGPSESAVASQEAVLPPGVDQLGGDARHRWKAGRLPGYVGPEGLVEVDGQPYRVDVTLAGRPYEVRGDKVRRVRVGGSWVKKTAL